MFDGKGGRRTEWIERETTPVPIFSSESDKVCTGQHTEAKRILRRWGK